MRDSISERNRPWPLKAFCRCLATLTRRASGSPVTMAGHRTKADTAGRHGQFEPERGEIAYPPRDHHGGAGCLRKSSPPRTGARPGRLQVIPPRQATKALGPSSPERVQVRKGRAPLAFRAAVSFANADSRSLFSSPIRASSAVCSSLRRASAALTVRASCKGPAISGAAVQNHQSGSRPGPFVVAATANTR